MVMAVIKRKIRRRLFATGRIFIRVDLFVEEIQCPAIHPFDVGNAVLELYR